MVHFPTLWVPSACLVFSCYSDVFRAHCLHVASFLAFVPHHQHPLPHCFPFGSSNSPPPPPPTSLATAAPLSRRTVRGVGTGWIFDLPRSLEGVFVTCTSKFDDTALALAIRGSSPPPSGNAFVLTSPCPLLSLSLWRASATLRLDITSDGHAWSVPLDVPVVGPATPTPTPVVPPNSTAAIVGGAVGGAVAVIVIIGAVVCVVRRRRAAKVSAPCTLLRAASPLVFVLLFVDVQLYRSLPSGSLEDDAARDLLAP